MSLSLALAALLSACGGDVREASNSPSLQKQGAPLATGITVLELEPGFVPAEAAQQYALPLFHAAPLLLEAPDDAAGQASGRRSPHEQNIPQELRRLSSTRLTVQAMQSRHVEAARSLAADGTSGTSGAAPLAASGVVTTYTPAQIRAAYGLPALPADFSVLTAAQAAQLGAGQTIYIVDARHDPNVAAELAVFNKKFALPTCSSKAIAVNASLPLASASGNACELAVVYSTASGAMSATTPAYDSGWATEITLDVQWAHATAPLARIILIEAADASYDALLGAVKLANAMGPGIVSMSFGGDEGSWTASTNSTFAAANMTYLAATGDSGAAVSWPAVSPYVLAVGGTTLSYAGGGTRSEVGWSGTGGGTSRYTALPSYQNNAVPGMGTLARRTVADVAFNADPSTGQYVAVIPSGSSSVTWISAGGTSLSTPQWAGLIAVANATRLQAGKAVLGAPHAALYGQISTVPGTYASAFADVVSGSDGTCASCSAKTGYDQLTGLGTPNAVGLLATLSGLNGTLAPVVTPATINGKAGTALSFTVGVTAANAVTYTLSGAPSGMSISSAGVVSWAAPVAGSYAVTVTARDSQTALSGQGVYTIVIAAQSAASAPVLNPATVSGKAGVALSFTVQASSANALSYALSGAPSGMSIASTGVVSWASPVAGSYGVTVTVKDSKTGLSAQALYTVNISAGTAAAAGLTITAPAMTGLAGLPLSGAITISAPGTGSVRITISGAPVGMMFSLSGMNVIPYWANPVAGSYALLVTASDTAGNSATATVPVRVLAR